GYSTFKLADFVQAAVISKVTPSYPEEAKNIGLSGMVYVRVLIDEKGRVEKVCADPKLSSTSQSALVEAAQNEDQKWTFKPNFGFPRVPKRLKGRYLEDILGFSFLPTDHEQANKGDKKNSTKQH